MNDELREGQRIAYEISRRRDPRLFGVWIVQTREADVVRVTEQGIVIRPLGRGGKQRTRTVARGKVWL